MSKADKKWKESDGPSSKFNPATPSRALGLRELAGVPVRVRMTRGRPAQYHLVPRGDDRTVCDKPALVIWRDTDVEATDARVCKKCRRIHQPPQKPQRGARTKALQEKERKAANKLQKQRKARAAKKSEDTAPAPAPMVPVEIAPKKKRVKQHRLGDEEDEPVGDALPEATWSERQITQRLGASTHFKASLDTETFDEFVNAGTFLQRVEIMKSAMRAIPTAKVIPEGCHEAEAHVLVREAEAAFGLGEKPYDFAAAKKKQKPIEETPPPAPAREAPAASVCAKCSGSREVLREDKTPGGTIILSEPCADCRPEEHAEFRKNFPLPPASEPEAPTSEAPRDDTGSGGGA